MKSPDCLYRTLFASSLPSRECGLKYYVTSAFIINHPVTPFAGVWIEILPVRFLYSGYFVTPFAGVWIEIGFKYKNKTITVLSLPSRECGLKSRKEDESDQDVSVTPFAGVWIEILKSASVP